MSRTLVIGAGMAGLTAARLLTDRGADVLVVDKGRAVGGRMATRRVGDAAFDHGA
ncbi:MAG: FAD-dependent oxidoreductase, partial [Actinobacteria bacterium]|nr:NAD(P)/FAD-dependent oxidoreductase [Actinomycetota bacterium]NIS30400.1 NAD(P)/FAD-dependent oxidoreductase [Actinomycetota bacterium]NIU65630.1 NAD(P)/FAD-dependent oxidoreductase [Actinomycetota bacterium]NIW27434.1 FAD-dependent oxidoreductase [Actinomycetota bacterium]NIX20837.1 FAD-dependent oxidoreductase [Actinomycetota bacterium]